MGVRLGGISVDVGGWVRWGWGGGEGFVLGGQGGCDRRIEVFGKIHKQKFFLGGGGGGGGLSSQLVPKSTRTLVNSYLFWSTRT